MHLNACSLIRNFHKFARLLDATQHEFSTIGILVMWLNDVNQNYVNITGHRFIISNRVDKCGGSTGLICMTLALTFSICLICILLTLHYLTQSLGKLKIHVEKNLIVHTIYCPLNENFLEFMESFQPFIEQVTRVNKLCYMMGDFNLNQLNSDLPSITNDFVNMLFSRALFALI